MPLLPSLRRLRPLLLLLALAPAVASAAGQATVSATAEPATAKPGEVVTVHVVVDIDPKYHAQSHTPSEPTYIPLTVKPDANPAATFADAKYPAGTDHDYPGLGKLNVYTGRVTIDLPATIKADAPAGPLTLSGRVRYQACDDNACFPPQRPPFSVTLTVAAGPATAAAAATRPAVATTAAAAPPGPPAAAAPPVATAFGLDLAGQSAVVVLALAFVVGIIFNAVPCVLPVVPLKIAGFYEAAQHDRRKCLLLGAAFSAGLVATFAVLAVVVVGLHKASWGQQFQSPWFTAAIVVILTVFAASQFGLFTVNLPMAAYGFQPRHDTYFGSVLFGILTAVLSTPCTIGPFAGLMAWALAAPAALGATAIVVVGCGMASPYLLLSAFPQVVRRFPRTGPVGEIVKQSLAFLVLATAFYFARPFLGRVPESAFWWVLFAFVPAAGLFLVWRTIRALGTPRATAIAAAIAVVVTLPSAVLARRLASRPYEWQPFSQAALDRASADGRPVLIDFTADWCPNCHYLEATVLKDAAVVAAVKNGRVLMLKADVTREDAPAKPLLDKLSPAGAIPVTAVYRPGRPDPQVVLHDLYGADALLTAIKAARPDA